MTLFVHRQKSLLLSSDLSHCLSRHCATYQDNSPATRTTHRLPGQLIMKKKLLGAAVGGALAVVGAPVALAAMGFTGTGIAAASIAAKMMSAAAIANGGGVAAGSLVATLQSAGVLGLSTSTNAILGAVGAVAGALL
ncbi:interferon alpha-inducible protein 27-like protein 2 [Mus caroli]|uniref:Interferon alpha-inducible protein 27-like protein 2 n=1 Tax=Mus caroli TaxID=10089 RepID=A0A6P7RZJ5_MUSCR|nr:interferon alpha-inducible protein 27-like protein 2 [Mus caroli]